ncbi:hypothetical protein KY361_07140 [Candidatus Woesearchaeota archaeon]|nr:hypothetical protein [Candidatus Woesearchaeota archaeon]
MSKLKDFFKGFKEGMHSFGSNVTAIINSSLLTIVYLIGVGLTSIFAKLFGKHFLDIKLAKKKNSYWSDLDLKKKPIDEYYRQF